MLRSENKKQYIDPPALQRSAMSIENGILTLPHSSGVLCVLKRYAVSLRKILKIVQSLVIIGFTIICTAYGFLDHSLKQDCATMQSH